jgi:hypothetical protein
VPTETLEAYVKIWSHVGYEMGIVPELLPTSYAEAGRLANLIIDDQIDAEAARESEYTKVLLNSLLDFFRSEAPPGMKWVPAALMRHMFHGEHEWIADALGVPHHRIREAVVGAGIRVEAKVFNHRLFRIGTRFIPTIMFAYDRAGRPSFRVPSELAEKWGIKIPGLREVLDETPI